MKIHLPFGLRDNKVVHISEINDNERGLKCNCICPSCGVTLQARIGMIRRRHFAHNSENCQGATESGLHKFAKEVLVSNNRIFLPDYVYDTKVLTNGKYFNYSHVETEKRVGNVIVDAVLSDGANSLFVEIVVTHDVDEHKYNKFTDIGDSVLRINLNKIHKSELLSANFDEISKLIVDNSEYKTWVFNKKANLKIQNIIQEKMALDKKRIEDQEKLRLKKEETNKNIVNKFVKDFRNNKELVYDIDYKTRFDKLLTNRFNSRMINELNQDYLNFMIQGELIFECERRVWQTLIFERFILKNSYDSFRIKNIVKWIDGSKKLPINGELRLSNYEIRNVLKQNGYKVATLEEVLYKYLYNIAINNKDTLVRFDLAIEVIDQSLFNERNGYDHYEFKIHNLDYYKQLYNQKKHRNEGEKEYVVVGNGISVQVNNHKNQSIMKTDEMLYEEAKQIKEENPDGPWYDSENNKYGICEVCGFFTRDWFIIQNNSCKCNKCFSSSS